jgi:hypothetical protein
VSWRRAGRRSSNRRTRDEDELGRIRLDEDFVREARVIELSAEQRAAKRRRDGLRQRMEEGRRQTTHAVRLHRRTKRRRRAPAVVAVLVAVSLFGWLVAQSGLLLRPSSSLPIPTDRGAERFEYAGEILEFPSPSHEQASGPLGQPAPLAVASDKFRFMRLRPGSTTPVAYDPCRPIHVVVNARTAPPKAAVILNEALDSVRRATGLALVVDGPTDEAPNPKRPPYQPSRYADRWAPILVAWSDPVESPALAGDVAGTGGSLALTVGDDRVYVTGVVALDGPQIAEILDRRGGRAQARAVILHELGHLVGLDHVPYTTELMSPERDRDRLSYGAGDLSGLALLGQGKCFPAV